MNPDPMDYQMDVDAPPISQSQAMSQPICPYRPQGDAPHGSTAFQSGWSHNPHLNSTMSSFNPISSPGRLYWGNMHQQNSQQPEAMATGHNHPPVQQGRPSNAVGYEYNTSGQNQEQFLNPQRFLQSDDNRPVLPRMTSDVERFHNGNESRPGENHAPATISPAPPVLPNYNPLDDATQRRNEYLQAQSIRAHQEAQSNRNPLPPPTLTVQSTFFPTHLPQPNFTGNGNSSFFSQSSQSSPYHSSRSVPIPQYSESSRQSLHVEQAQRPAWTSREAYNSSGYADDSDDEFVEGFREEEHIRRESRGSPSHNLRHAAISGHNPRRVAMNTFEAEEREIAVDRARAARRAAAASVKLVASSAALAALERVELSELTGDDRNCIICYNEFGIRNPDGNVECAVRLPKCKHIFGDHCLKHWLKDSDSCPYCRDKLPSEPKRSQADDIRRMFALSRPMTVDSQRLISMNDERTAFLISDSRLSPEHRHPAGQSRENQAQVQAQIQALRQAQLQQRARYDEMAVEEREARLRYQMQRQEEWNAAHPHGSAYPARSIPDHDNRRRNRQRANSIRNSTQSNQNRYSSPAIRSVRDGASQNSHMRSPGHGNRPSFDGASTNSPRSETPHPGALGTASTPNFSTPGGRPSSLPSETSPLREATMAGAQSPNSNTEGTVDMELTPFPNGADEEFPSVGGVLDSAGGGGQGQPMWNGGRPASESFVGGVPSTASMSDEDRQTITDRYLWMLAPRVWDRGAPQ